MTTTLHRSLPSFRVNCPHCGLLSKEFDKSSGNCRHEASFVDDVSVDEVRGALEELLIQKEEKRKLSEHESFSSYTYI
jgi:hypothetical protein